MASHEARSQWSRVLDEAADGQGTIIIRNSKEAAGVVPAHLARLLPLVYDVVRELGESLQMSNDPDILEAYERGKADLAREDIVWYEV